MSVTFTIEDKWSVLCQVNLTIEEVVLYEHQESGALKSKSPVLFLAGTYCPVQHSPFNIVFGEPDKLDSITVDGKYSIQGDGSKVRPVFERIQKAIKQNTGSATLVGKNLTIITGQP